MVELEMEDIAESALGELTEIESIAIRFAGDSGDGSQLIGKEFANTSVIVGNDISTLPDFPAEIRAPAGTLPGVSGFQIRISSEDIFTPGDEPQVLVAMNPAALKANVQDLPDGGIIIANTDNFTRNNLRKAGYDSDPLENHALANYRVVKVPLTTLHKAAVAHVEGLTNRQIDMMKNFFALGLSYWIFDRPLDPTVRMLKKKFHGKSEIIDGNVSTLKAGYNFGETMEEFQVQYRVKKAAVSPGTYRAITGTQATAIGMVTAAHKAGKTLFYGSYPITPASAVLEELAALKNFDVRTFQAEDEISALGSVIGAAFGGAFAATGTSGPGIALKSEAMNLALMMELPLVICDFQRGGPSTGMPTKTEQSDLLQCMFGRNGDSPIPIVSPATPSDCFDMIIEAFRIAVETMSPVIFLSDGYLNNSAEPWKIPDPDDILPIRIAHATEPTGFMPYLRDARTLARTWALPGTPGLEHRLGGLGKEDVTGNVSYDPDDTQHMANIRAERLTRIADRIPLQHVMGPKSGALLVLGWGCTYGAIRSAVRQSRQQGYSVAAAHLRYLNPFPKNLGAILSRYKTILVPELNMGQLSLLLKARYPGQRIVPFNKVQGLPFKISELAGKIAEILGTQA